MKNYILIILFVLLLNNPDAFSDDNKGVVFSSGKSIGIACDASEEQVVFSALELLRQDIQSVLSASTKILGDNKPADIIVGTVGQSSRISKLNVDFSEIRQKKEAFMLRVLPGGRLLIAGSDKRGTAYGIMELSRLLGVSPWKWWADSSPSKITELKLPAGYKSVQSPSVEFRGIFINDEDWGLMPWSWQTYEPTTVKGQIGPKTHEQIFELLLRLRANTFWPAMHSCSVPFYFTKGNKEMAEKFGIYIGTSHCEPMMRNANGEWTRDGKGKYDFVNNRQSVLSFWNSRLKEVAKYDNIYTLGIRGVHDGKMEGANTIAEQKSALTDIFLEQRKLLQNDVNRDLVKIPQVFIPYKEVEEVYDSGLQVPDDVSLIWCDDNYGYIRRLPNEKERKRTGGNGIYYHASYWGRPHDYLWLGTTNPALISQQMAQAYDAGAQKIWILNVGDIKPSEYQIELFLDMAWDIRKVRRDGVERHLHGFLQREFGEPTASDLDPAMREYYRLAWIRRPEFMGNTRTEEKDPSYKVVKDLPWSETQIRNRLTQYQALATDIEQLGKRIPEDKQPAFFQLVEYPVLASAEMNKKMLFAQLARHGKADWNESDKAYDRIAELTKKYNNGKWNRIMDFQPRQLAVFDKVKRGTAQQLLLPERTPVRIINGADFQEGKATKEPGLGYEGKAVLLQKGDWIEFPFENVPADSLVAEIYLVPTHPTTLGDKLRFSFSVDGKISQTVDYATKGRSEEWKENVLDNRAVRKISLGAPQSGTHKIRFQAEDDGIVLDQIAIFNSREASSSNQ